MHVPRPLALALAAAALLVTGACNENGDDATATEITTTSRVGEGNLLDFCDQLAVVDQAAAGANTPLLQTTPLGVKARYKDLQASIHLLAEVAPDVIYGSAKSLADTYDEYGVELEAEGWNPRAVPQDDTDQFTRRVESAVASLAAFSAEECGPGAG